MTVSTPLTCALTFAFAAAVSLGPASAQDDTTLALELNNATDVEAACRLTFIATNGTGVALEGLSYEIVLYDPEGIVPDDGFLLFEFGDLPDGKTKVVQFLLEDRNCASISRVLVNDVTECRSDAGQHDFCLDGLSVSSRNEIDFSL